VIEAGANALVAGSAVFGAKDYAEGTFKKKIILCECEAYIAIGEIQCDSDICHGFKSLVAIKGIKASKRPEPVSV